MKAAEIIKELMAEVMHAGGRGLNEAEAAAMWEAAGAFDRSAEAKLLEAAREYRDTTQDETATRTRRYAYAMRVLELCKELKP